MSYTLIDRRELTEAASSIQFAGIPQIYTDLLVLVSARNTVGTNVATLTFNSGGTYTNRWLNGNGTASNSGNARFDYIANPSDFTAATYGSSEIYIPGYTSGLAKSFFSEGVSENNGTAGNQVISSGLWSGTEAITSITFTPANSGNFIAGSSISLYGINRQQAIGKPKAIGGAITFANGYWIHTFNSSGTFYTQNDLSCEALVVAGGGGGGNGGGAGGGGGGAGGYIETLTTLASGNWSVTVGAGGSRTNSFSFEGSSGFNSAVGPITSIGGGGGGSYADVENNGAGLPGGSGGGGGFRFTGSNSVAAGLGTAGQGNNGGSGSANPSFGSGGGGGASSSGGNGSGNVGGNGGAGRSSSISSVSVSYAGGGGGSCNSGGTNGVGTFGGGNGERRGVSLATSGAANTGGGGGGTAENLTFGNGGSGIVIIRYLAD